MRLRRSASGGYIEILIAGKEERERISKLKSEPAFPTPFPPRPWGSPSAVIKNSKWGGGDPSVGQNRNSIIALNVLNL